MPVRSPPVVGLALPATRVNGGYFSSRDKYQTALGDVIMAIMTPLGSRPMRRGEGTMFDLFGPADQQGMKDLRDAAADSIRRSVPQVVVRKLEFAKADGAPNTVNVHITFALADDPATTRSETISLSRAQTR
jgi:phage baseplate assembly protein W